MLKCPQTILKFIDSASEINKSIINATEIPKLISNDVLLDDLSYESISDINLSELGSIQVNTPEEWICFKETTFDQLDQIREEYKIVKDNVRKTKEGSTVYMLCKVKGCPVKYKVRIALEPKSGDVITIQIKSDHTHNMEDFKKIVHQGVKQKVKALIEPMLLNKVKPNKISKILDDYVIQGKLTQDDLPTTARIANLRKTMTKKTNVVQTEGELRKILEEFLLITFKIVTRPLL